MSVPFANRQLKPAPDFSRLPVTADSLRRLRRLRDAVALQRTPLTHRFTVYRDDPVRFVREALREHVWSKQEQILQSLVACRRTAVRSCHDSGKSWLAARATCWWIASHPPGEAFVVTSAPTFPQVRAILWREINRAHSKGDLPGYCNQVEWMLDNELVAFGRKPDDNDPAAFQGIHAKYVLVIFDEACGIPVALWDAADSLIANEGGRFLAIGNPDDPNTEFARNCAPGSGWNTIGISAFETPNLTDEEIPDDLRPLLVSSLWVEEKRRKWGVTSPVYISKVLGEFPEVSEDSLIPISWVRDAVQRELEPGLPVELGVDVARFGRNETVICVRRGSVFRIWKTMRKRDLMEVTGNVVAAIRETGATRVKIDDNGLGGGVTDRLKEMQREGTLTRGCLVVPVNVGMAVLRRDDLGQPEDRREKGVRSVETDSRFHNLKAEVNWQLRDRFETGDIDIEDDDDLQAQVCAVRYSLNSKGKLVIEGKDELEERLRKVGGATGDSASPDRHDALVLANADVEEDSDWTKMARASGSRRANSERLAEERRRAAEQRGRAA